MTTWYFQGGSLDDPNDYLDANGNHGLPGAGDTVDGIGNAAGWRQPLG